MQGDKSEEDEEEHEFDGEDEKIVLTIDESREHSPVEDIQDP